MSITSLTPLARSESPRFLEDVTPEPATAQVAPAQQPDNGTPLRNYSGAIYRILDMTAPLLSGPLVFGAAGPAMESPTASTQTEAAVFAEPSDLEKIDRVNHDRLLLLARRYAQDGELTSEENARLLVSSIRVERGIPRVTDEDFDYLKQVKATVAEIGENTQARRDRLNLR